jgi:hypothetical protein
LCLGDRTSSVQFPEFAWCSFGNFVGTYRALQALQVAAMAPQMSGGEASCSEQNVTP